MQSKKFQRKKEDFVCDNCGHEVRGSGFTNHCPKCLWSKHVDVNPGDRAEACGSMMKPVGVEENGGEYTIIHKCKMCGKISKNKAKKEDDFDTIVKLSSKL